VSFSWRTPGGVLSREKGRKRERDEGECQLRDSSLRCQVSLPPFSSLLWLDTDRRKSSLYVRLEDPEDVAIRRRSRNVLDPESTRFENELIVDEGCEEEGCSDLEESEVDEERFEEREDGERKGSHAVWMVMVKGERGGSEEIDFALVLFRLPSSALLLQLNAAAGAERKKNFPSNFRRAVQLQHQTGFSTL